MDHLNIQVPKGVKIGVIGDIHSHHQQFFDILQKLQSYNPIWIVSCGDIYFKGFDTENIIVDTLESFHKNGNGFCVRGNNELKAIRKARQENKMTPQLKWIEMQPLAISFCFQNNTRCTVLHGGVLNRFTWDDLKNNLEISYIRDVTENDEIVFSSKIDKKKNIFSWHEKYQGKFSYIIAGHAANHDGKIKLYNYSANIDSCVYGTGILSAMIFGENGIVECIQVSGLAARPSHKNNFPEKKTFFISAPIKDK